jgi:autotransporter-associated beta strand protein
LCLAVVIFFAANYARAATLYWDAGGTTPGWTNVLSWSTVSSAGTPDPAAAPGASDTAYFNISSLTTPQTVNLYSAPSVQGIVFASAGRVTLATGTANNRTLTVGSGGISLPSGSGGALIGSTTSNRKIAITLSASQTWQNDSGGVLYSVGTPSGDLSLGAYLLTVTGTGNTILSNIVKSTSGGNGLVKNGVGKLTLGGVNTYNGATTVNAGTLALASGSTIGSSTLIALAAGATFDVSALSGGYALGSSQTLGGSGTVAGDLSAGLGSKLSPATNAVGTVAISGGLTLTDGATLLYDITDTVTADKITVGGALNPSGTTTVSLASPGTLAAGTYTLIEVTGSLNGSSNNFSVTSPSPNTFYSIAYEAGSPNKVLLIVRDDDSVLSWVGDGAGNAWDNSAATWTNRVSGGALVAFADGVNKVEFSDLGSANATVVIDGAVAPVGTTVDASANYVFQGAGGIGGTNGIAKAGFGTLTVGTANTFSGPVAINAGALLATHGSAMGASDGGTTVGSGGTLGLQGDITVASEALSMVAALSGDAYLRNVSGSNTWGGSLTVDTGPGSYRTRIYSDAGFLKLSGPIVTSGSSDFVLGGEGDGEISGNISGTRTLFKSSSGYGTWTLSGNNTYVGTTTAARGKLRYTGSLTNASGVVSVSAGYLEISGSLSTGSGLWQMGTSATATSGVLNVRSGANVVANSFECGRSAGAGAVMNVTGGYFSTTNAGDLGFRFGTAGYGALYQTGGTVSVASFQIGAGGLAVARVSGGLLAVNPSYVIVGRGSTGVLTVDAGGTLNHIAANNQISVAHATGSRGELNLTGGTLDNTGHNVGFGGGLGSSGVGFVNLDDGVLITSFFNNADGTNRVSFGGGTLRAATNSASFMPSDLPVYVNGAFGTFAGGATIDTAGFVVTNGAALLAPSGDGVASIELTDGGSGYFGEPYVALTGDGFGATAVADMQDDGSGKGTLKVTAIRITNPGTGYTTASAVLTGGVNTVAATLGAVALAPNTSGGLTKLGAGTLALAGANTYTGATTVAAGLLQLSAAGVFASSSALTLADGSLDAGAYANAFSSLTVTSNATLTVSAATQLAFTAQTADVWPGSLIVAGELGSTSVRFQPALSEAQLDRIRYQDGRRMHSTPDGYLYVLPFGSTLFVR